MIPCPLRATNFNVLGVIVNSLFTGDTYGYAYYRKSSYYSRHKYYDSGKSTDPAAGNPPPSPPPGEDPGPEKKVA